VTLAGEKLIRIDAGVELPRVYMSWPTPRSFAPGDAELDLVASILSSGKTSRLYKRLVYDLQIAQDVSVHQGSSQLASHFSIVATAQPAHTAEELRTAIDVELARLISGGISDGELARAKIGYLSGALFELEKVSSRANTLNEYNQMTGDPGYLQKDFLRYTEPTTEQVVSAARRWLPLDRRVVAIVTPKKGAPVCGVLGAP
jgi:zinc protease